MGSESNSGDYPKIFGKQGKSTDTRRISYTDQGKTYSQAEMQSWNETKNEINRLKQDIKAQNAKTEKLSEVKTIADFTRWVEKCGEDNITALESKIGVDKTWKILLLTFAATSKEFLKIILDVFKIGEGIGETAMIFSKFEKKDFDDLAKILYASKGAAGDILNGLALSPAVGVGVKELAAILSKLNITRGGFVSLIPELLKSEVGAVGPGVSTLIQKESIKKTARIAGKGMDMPFHQQAQDEFAILLRQQALSMRDGGFSAGKEVWYDDVIGLIDKSPKMKAKMKEQGFSIAKDDAGAYLAKSDRTGRPEMVFRFRNTPKLEGKTPKTPDYTHEDPLSRKMIIKELEMDKSDLLEFSRLVARDRQMLPNSEIGSNFMRDLLQGKGSARLAENLKKGGFDIKQESFEGEIRYVLKRYRGGARRVLMAF